MCRRMACERLRWIAAMKPPQDTPAPAADRQLPLYFSEAERRFREFHRNNPYVYAQLVKLARQAKAAGKNRVGIKMLFEVVRWYAFIDTTDRYSDFKLNNNYHSRYARLIMEQESDLAGIFETRVLRS